MVRPEYRVGTEPEMMWLRKPREGETPQGVTKPYCYHIHQFEELRPVLLDVVLGDRAATVLAAAKGWMTANGSWVMTVVLVVIGAVLLGNGVSGLRSG